MQITCDQCAMLSINGIPCHETGCPNARKTFIPERGWVLFVQCRECGSDVEAGETCDCQNNEWYCDNCGETSQDGSGTCITCGTASDDPNPIKASYENGECPDCGEPIPDNIAEGEACKNCGHVFCTPREND